MRHLAILAAAALILTGTASMAQRNPVDELRAASSEKFKPGQVWSFNAPNGNERATATVLKIESHPKLGTIVHIALRDVTIRTRRFPNGAPLNVDHLPFFQDAFERSVISLLRTGPVPASGLEAYTGWREEMRKSNSLSAYSISISEAVGLLEKALAGE